MRISSHAVSQAKERHGIEREGFEAIVAQAFPAGTATAYRKAKKGKWVGPIRVRRVQDEFRILVGERGKYPDVIRVIIKDDTVVTVLPKETKKNDKWYGKYREIKERLRKKNGVVLEHSQCQKVMKMDREALGKYKCGKHSYALPALVTNSKGDKEKFMVTFAIRWDEEDSLVIKDITNVVQGEFGGEPIIFLTSLDSL